MPKLPDPVRFNVVSAPPEFSRTIKLVLVVVIVAVATPVPAISINKLVFVLEDSGPISSKVKSKEMIEFACAILIPPSAKDAATVSPSVILSNFKDCPAPNVVLIVAPLSVVPESNSIPVMEVKDEKSKV